MCLKNYVLYQPWTFVNIPVSLFCIILVKKIIINLNKRGWWRHVNGCGYVCVYVCIRLFWDELVLVWFPAQIGAGIWTNCCYWTLHWAEVFPFCHFPYGWLNASSYQEMTYKLNSSSHCHLAFAFSVPHALWILIVKHFKLWVVCWSLVFRKLLSLFP